MQATDSYIHYYHKILYTLHFGQYKVQTLSTHCYTISSPQFYTLAQSTKFILQHRRWPLIHIWVTISSSATPPSSSPMTWLVTSCSNTNPIAEDCDNQNRGVVLLGLSPVCKILPGCTAKAGDLSWVSSCHKASLEVAPVIHVQCVHFPHCLEVQGCRLSHIRKSIHCACLVQRNVLNSKPNIFILNYDLRISLCLGALLAQCIYKACC